MLRKHKINLLVLATVSGLVCVFGIPQFSSGKDLDEAEERARVEGATPSAVIVNPGVPQSPAQTSPAGTPTAGTPPMPKVEGQPAAPPVTVGPKPVSRADRPAQPAKSDELKARPDSQGLVKFNFQGQPWLEVLEWLAKISHLSLDWQELPGDHLNLATQRAYTVEETRDLINRHLLDRGYTMLRNGEVLTVVNIKKIDPSMVPRVRPKDLVKRDAHEFVKVSFTLDWMLAEQAVEELKPMISPNGKLVALKSTNRLEAMDAVTNLREIHEVLEEEQSRDGKEQLVQEFPLKHTRAVDADRMLRALMGMPKNPDSDEGAAASGGGIVSPEQAMAMQQQMQQQMQQMQQQGQPQAVPPGAAGATKKEVYLVVNSKRNSLLVQAPADKMAVITQAIQRLDVGNDEPGTLMHAINNTKIYRLSEIDPAALAKIMEEMGNLDPTTRIKVDTKHRSLIVTGALADHLVISELIKKLDGTDRRFEVKRLRRLEAEYVAGTIEFMMGVGEKKSDDSMNPFMAYRFGMEIGGGGEEKKANGKFRVSADTENNRLLLWTNDIELKEVENLLIKLGETPSKEGSPDRVRVIEAYDPIVAKRLAEQLQRTRPELKISVEETPGAEIQPEVLEPETGPLKPNQVEPPAKSQKTTQAQPRARNSKPIRTSAAAKSPSRQTGRESSSRQAGQSGRILQAGRASPFVVLTRLQQPASTDDVQDELSTTGLETANPPRSQVPPVFNPNHAILPTFAPESSSAELHQSDNEASETPPIRNPFRPRSEFGQKPQSLKRPEGFDLDPAEIEFQDSHARNQVKSPPIQIVVTPNGQLILASPDTQALDELEDTISQLAPPRRDFKIFHLKNRNTWPTSVVWNLEKYFGTEDKKGGGMKYSPYWGMYPSDKKDTGPNTLSKRRIPKFISDSDSHTILVTGADPEQLRVIEELINIYDQPDQSDSKALRLNKIFQLKYSKSRIVADAIKEVYRDLLSANDPALQAANQNKDQKPVAADRQYTYIYGGGDDADKDKNKEPEAPIKFKGLLSVGVDELSNTIIVSAQEGLLENIGEMIESLDAAAMPTQSTLQVVRVRPHVEASGLQDRLAKILTRPQPVQPQPGQPNPNQPNGQPMNPTIQPQGSNEGSQ